MFGGKVSLILWITSCLWMIINGQTSTHQGLLIGTLPPHPCLGKNDALFCFTCAASSFEECATEGMYRQCSTISNLQSVCRRVIEYDNSNLVTSVIFRCERFDPTDPDDGCVGIRGEERCRILNRGKKCGICTYDNGHTPEHMYAISGCKNHMPGNPCEDFNSPSQTYTTLESPALGDNQANDVVYVNNGGYVQGDTNLWCWTCAHSRNEERCYAEGQYKKCPDSGTHKRAICLEERITKTSGETRLTRRCGVRSRCDPRMVGYGNYLCDYDEDGNRICRSCNFGDPQDASVYGGTSVFHCSSLRHMGCVCRGDPHCTTLAGTKIQLSGACEYVFARDYCSAGTPRKGEIPRYIISARMRKSPAGVRSSIESVTISLPRRNQMITIHQGRLTTFTQNGVTKTFQSDDLPFFSDNENYPLIIANASEFMHVYVDKPNIHVLFNGDRSMQINLPRWVASDTYDSSPLCGLCGPANMDESGEMNGSGEFTAGPNSANCVVQTTPGQSASTTRELLASWISSVDTSDAHCVDECAGRSAG